MGWLSPPDRREITLLLFCLTIYVLAYNLENSLQLLGVDSVATSGVVFSRIGLGKTRAIDRDGRKPQGWQDPLELQIYGDWSWDEGSVAGNGVENSQRVGTGPHGATWIGRKNVGEVAGKQFGEVSVDRALSWWRQDIPPTNVLKHTPGYTILDNVYVFNGQVYLVSDNPREFPTVSAIVSSTSAGLKRWTLLTRRQAVVLFGEFGGIIRGVSWMAADITPHNSTLLALWKTYSSLDPAIDSEGRTKLAPPHRLVFPHSRFFTDDEPPFENHWIRRRRVDTGFHPYLAKAAFPHLTVMYLQDFEDYAQMRVPFVFERLVVADRKAASRFLEPPDPEFLLPFELQTSEFWFEPVRKTMESFLDLPEENRKKRAVTYIITQENQNSPVMKKEDHEMLVSALKKMERNIGCEVHVVFDDTRRTAWTERIEAIARSTIVLGVHGDHLMDFAFMKRTPQSTLMEFYPAEKFARDRAIIAKSLGQNYVAWSGGKKLTGGDMSQLSRPLAEEEVSIDVEAVVRTVQQIISKS